MAQGGAPLERTWTVRSAWRTVGIPDRACRRAVAKGLIPRKALRGEHLVALRIIAAIEHFPEAPDAPGPEMLEERSRMASKAAAECWYQGDEFWLLVVTPLDARIARNESIVMGLLEGYRGTPLLVLPIGKWCADVREAGS